MTEQEIFREKATPFALQSWNEEVHFGDYMEDYDW